MDAYLKSTKPSTAATLRASSVKPAEGKARPYASLADASKPCTRATSSNRIQGGVREANKALIKTLGQDDNPITNSTAYHRTLHVQSCSSGHQGGGGPSSKWSLHRNAKLTLQAAEAESTTLKGVVACISGYTGDDITNTQLRELVQRQGGKMVTVPSARCTHVFIRENLSGSKAQKFLESNRKNGTKLVTPQWAIECAKRGRRVSEAKFAAPVYNETQESTYTIFAAAQGSVSLLDAFIPSSDLLPALDSPWTASTSLIPPAPSTPRTRARTRSLTGSSPCNGDCGPNTILLSTALTPRTTSPRKCTPATIASANTGTATSLLLAQLAEQAAQRVQSNNATGGSPGRQARTGTKRRSTHVATWECAADVRSPPRLRGMQSETGKRAKNGKEPEAVSGGGKTRGRNRDGGRDIVHKEQVLVLSSSDTEGDLRGPHQDCVEATGGGEADIDTDEWGMPPSGQGG